MRGETGINKRIHGWCMGRRWINREALHRAMMIMIHVYNIYTYIHTRMNDSYLLLICNNSETEYTDLWFLYVLHCLSFCYHRLRYFQKNKQAVSNGCLWEGKGSRKILVFHFPPSYTIQYIFTSSSITLIIFIEIIQFLPLTFKYDLGTIRTDELT